MRNQNYGSGTLTSSEGKVEAYLDVVSIINPSQGTSPRELTESEKCSLAPGGASSSLLSLHSSATALRAFGQSDRHEDQLESNYLNFRCRGPGIGVEIFTFFL